VGALGLAVFGAQLGWPGLTFEMVAVNLTLLGFCGGFYVVPVNALVQHRPEPGNKGGVIAASAFLSWVGILLAGGGLYFLLARVLHFGPREIFLTGGLLSFLGAVVFVWVLPESIFRLILWVLIRTLYRVRVLGRDHIPDRGGALFVCNHLSLADALLLQASTDRPIRFVMFKGIYEMRLIKPWARISRAIPISSELRPREMIESLRTASEAIQAGEIVCIFAEGQITRIGQMLPFRRGFQKIMKDVEAPIVPVALDGVWGSIFSFEKRRFIWKLPRRIPHPVTVNYGKPLPHTATPAEVRQAVQELMAEAWELRKPRMKPLQRRFVATARRHPFRFAMADAQSPKVTFGAALVRTVFLARRLKSVWAGQEKVGLLLPPSVPGALANWAALLCGKVPVNLNYTLSEEALASCIRQCEIQTVVTSRACLEKVKLNVPGKVLYLEELAANPGSSEKLAAFLMAWLLPARWLERTLSGARHRRSADFQSAVSPTCSRQGVEDSPHARVTLGSSPAESKSAIRQTASLRYRELDTLATVIFSSGSTGEPKGVMLSHYNVGSNIEQMEQVFALTNRDRFLGVLPFFHSFGFTGTMALPTVLGVGVVFHPNPLDGKTIGQLVCDYEVTFLLATPTFLQIYMRGCSAEQFGSLRLVAVGAEKLPDRVATAFEEQFGIRPFEAYGCTECSPAITVNTHDFRSAGFRQIGAKRGKIGHPLPGVCVRIVDPASYAPLPLEQSGLLLVRGPNVMQGYLGKPDKTAEVLRDGWYVTGDVAAVDEDGFLQITDRLSRFSKIGGEMVPHIKVEEKLHDLAGVTEHSFVVTSAPDEKKGERLVVLHKLAGEKLQECLAKLAACDLPNLWKPKAEAFRHVEAFPLLGTGKLDLRKIKELAAQSTA
jgi:acyl-[acyl-carrier-protein]-phospholipid O-acyltransferase/long-chain-fatty-acid--[acyl-carrier-protein] ligase